MGVPVENTSRDLPVGSAEAQRRNFHYWVDTFDYLHFRGEMSLLLGQMRGRIHGTTREGAPFSALAQGVIAQLREIGIPPAAQGNVWLSHMDQLLTPTSIAVWDQEWRLEEIYRQAKTRQGLTRFADQQYLTRITRTANSILTDEIPQILQERAKIEIPGDPFRVLSGISLEEIQELVARLGLVDNLSEVTTQLQQGITREELVYWAASRGTHMVSKLRERRLAAVSEGVKERAGRKLPLREVGIRRRRAESKRRKEIDEGPTYTIALGGYGEKSPKHEESQDEYLMVKIGEGGAAVFVADGVSKGGRLSTDAAKAAVRIVGAPFSHLQQLPTTPQAKLLIFQAAQEAAAEIDRIRGPRPDEALAPEDYERWYNIGSTLVMAVTTRNPQTNKLEVLFFHVGDGEAVIIDDAKAKTALREENTEAKRQGIQEATTCLPIRHVNPNTGFLTRLLRPEDVQSLNQLEEHECFHVEEVSGSMTVVVETDGVAKAQQSAEDRLYGPTALSFEQILLSSYSEAVMQHPDNEVQQASSLARDRVLYAREKWERAHDTKAHDDLTSVVMHLERQDS